MNKKLFFAVPIIIVLAAVFSYLSKSKSQLVDSPSSETTATSSEMAINDMQEGMEPGVATATPAINTKTPTTATEPPKQVTETPAPDADVQVFVVTASNFKYDVTTIRVKKGVPVRIVLKNTEGFHDFKISEFGGTKKIRAGEQDVLEFTPTESGSFEFFCSVGSHRQMGMKGTLIVE